MISVIYSTCRVNPRLDLFLDSLYYDMKRENVELSLKIQIVIVDYHLQHDKSREEVFSKLNNNRFDIVHVSPKPSLWQGQYKITSKNMFCASIARNTGICYVKYDYVLFMDDNGFMKPGSLKHILSFCNKKLSVAFAYQYANAINYNEHEVNITPVENNGGIDVRIKQGDVFRKIHGSQLYGHCAMPLENILLVNGYDEISNGIGYEDLQFGIRLMTAGIDIFYSSDVLFYETKNISPEDHFQRVDFLLKDSDYDKLMKKYKIKARWHSPGSKHLSFLLLDMLMDDDYLTKGNDYNLRHLKNIIQMGNSFPIPNTENNMSFYGVYLKDIVDIWESNSNTIPINCLV